VDLQGWFIVRACFAKRDRATTLYFPCLIASRYRDYNMAPPRRATAVQAGKTIANCSHNHSWDDWVPQERLRKFTDENKELASNLKKDMDAQRRAASGRPASTSTTKKRPYGSDLAGSSARGSEDRSSAVPQPPRGGTKRGREIEGIDKVCLAMFACVLRSSLPPKAFALLLSMLACT